MSIKKSAAVILSCALMGALLIGCGGEEAKERNRGETFKK